MRALDNMPLSRPVFFTTSAPSAFWPNGTVFVPWPKRIRAGRAIRWREDTAAMKREAGRTAA